ncbi:hypothetical protein B5E58_00355 [Tyzzerella sp. An114]|uniref:LCP family protein n=1 Tax=Tyzzerella sp. An114 TaxID=1965545 RepID=UPI000B453B65|nr:LCP family protein [Tyzzerella sp. An114]OUQ60356.1 hypothetical protein B5E58_00355 [Tyzzerella sp. An114]HIT73268.1 LCP family protein [Candidatus Fimicola cottocaccae]
MHDDRDEYVKRKKKTKKRRKRSPIRTFFKIVISMVLAFVVMASAAVFAYTKLTGNSVESTSNNSFIDSILGKGIKLNVAVFGVDKDETRTDVMFVVHFDSKKKELGLLSIPRDTRVDICDEVKEIYEQNDRYYQTPTKINAVHAYGGDKGAECAVLQLEDLLGINIDHYVKVNIDGFGEIVDAIGGIDFYVPQDMYWDMRDTGDILIDLKEGQQVLDGDKAIQLVRFRRYAEGDVARVQVQQDFLKEAAKQILSTENIMSNIDTYIKTFFKYVKTDINIVDAIKYSGYIDDIDMENAVFETLPGQGQYVGGVSYYVYDPEATQEIVDKMFYGKGDETLEDGTISSKDKKIEVANGGDVNGLAGRKSEELQADGFTVNSTTTYKGERTEYTRIVVPKENMGEDLKKYFSDARVVVDESLISEGNDITIIIGTEQE